MIDTQLLNKLFGAELHSITTQANTDFCTQLGKGVAVGKVEYIERPLNKTECVDRRATVTAFALKKPTPDGKISIRVMPIGSVMQSDAQYFCVPREWWAAFVLMTPERQAISVHLGSSSPVR